MNFSGFLIEEHMFKGITTYKGFFALQMPTFDQMLHEIDIIRQNMRGIGWTDEIGLHFEGFLEKMRN